MKANVRRWGFFCGMFLILTAIALFGLSINIRIVPLNAANQQLNRDIAALREENEHLQLQLLEATTMAVLKEKADKTFQMQAPNPIRYLRRDDAE